MKIESLLLVPGGKTAIVLELKEQVFYKMALLVCVPICMSGVLCSGTVGNEYNTTLLLHPVNKFVAVITLICQDQFASQFKRFQQSLCHTDVIAVPAGKQKSQWIPKPIRYRMDFCCQASSASSGFLLVSPFLAPLACWWTLTVVLSSINVVSSTKSCSIRAERICSHTPAFVHARNRLYTLCHGAMVRIVPAYLARVSRYSTNTASH